MNRTPFYKVQKDTNVYYTDAEWAALTISDIPTTGSTNVTPNSSFSDRSTKAYYWKNANYNSSSNGYHLPTECQWEFAARGGSVGGTQWGYDYSGSNTASKVAWFNTSLSTVGQLQKNAKNLYDMSGNVWEWTNTPAHSYETSIELEGDIYIRRGGSWWHEDKNCRVSRRYASDHTKKTSGLGLRVVIRENIK